MSWRLPLLEVLGHPLGVVLRRVGVDPAPHTGMTEAAQLRAGPLVLARLHDVEPHAHLAPGPGALLDAQLRHDLPRSTTPQPPARLQPHVRVAHPLAPARDPAPAALPTR